MVNIYIYFNGNSDTLFQVGQYICEADKYSADRRTRDIELYDVLHSLYDADITEWYNKVYYENNNLLFLAYNGASSNYVCFLNENGETIIEPIKCDSDDEDDCYYPLDDKGFVFEKAGDSYNRIFYFCDHNGNITEYGDLTAFGGFSEGLALIIDEHGNMGYINHAGKVIIK